MTDRCTSCGKLFTDHLGTLTCKKYQEARQLLINLYLSVSVSELHTLSIGVNNAWLRGQSEYCDNRPGKGKV